LTRHLVHVWECSSFHFWVIFKSTWPWKNIKLIFSLVFFDNFDVLK
jgi:hypothetical protein